MGQEQSSASSGARQTESRTVRKTCYYELLGVDRQAADDE